mmetsp:Transcript_14415/g.18107  ORF Transcript_14415/g.18107 Transcript_14415/m.18107 type:complete len:225 (+) Transcript_14415:215-889(+)
MGNGLIKADVVGKYTPQRKRKLRASTTHGYIISSSNDIVSQYLPSFFREAYIIDDACIKICEQSWLKISNGITSQYISAEMKQHNLKPVSQFAELFYQILFSHAPQLKRFFKTSNIVSVQSKLTRSIEVIVTSSKTKIGHKIEMLEELGKKHCQFGVHPNHYAYFGTSLLRAVRVQLGTDYNLDVETSWSTMISHVLHVMLPVIIRHHQQKRTIQVADTCPNFS